MEARWIETMKLANWSIKRLKKIQKFKDNNSGGNDVDKIQ